jgi:glycosyltransferase involved in cell wall biosynthesis
MSECRVIFPHKINNIGGPASFQNQLVASLKAAEIEVEYAGVNLIKGDVILVVGGTRKLLWLLKCKFKGLKIVHRLDGLLWRHNIESVGVIYYWRSKLINLLLFIIRNFFADHVIYQSEFIQKWWREWYGTERCRSSIIYNSADLSVFTPGDKIAGVGSMICVEGNLPDDDVTLRTLIEVHTGLYDRELIHNTLVFGGLSSKAEKVLSSIEGLEIKGTVPRKKIIEAYGQSSLYLSLEILPPCPNSVIEAMASGVPVIGYDTGSLKELITPGAGEVVSYEGNPWALEQPNINALIVTAVNVLHSIDTYRIKTRERALNNFSITTMFKLYSKVLFEINS